MYARWHHLLSLALSEMIIGRNAAEIFNIIPLEFGNWYYHAIMLIKPQLLPTPVNLMDFFFPESPFQNIFHSEKFEVSLVALFFLRC